MHNVVNILTGRVNIANYCGVDRPECFEREICAPLVIVPGEEWHNIYILIDHGHWCDWVHNMYLLACDILLA